MKFITMEEFLKNDIEVQKIFIDWWQPSIGDLFVWNNEEDIHNMHEVNCCTSVNIVDMTIKNKGVNEGERIPLFTEGQLRQFIEDICGDIDLQLFNCFPYGLHEGFKENAEYEGIKAIDLLHAYWQIAIKIAKIIIKSSSNNV